jgi:hypothetical protein
MYCACSWFRRAFGNVRYEDTDTEGLFACQVLLMMVTGALADDVLARQAHCV